MGIRKVREREREMDERRIREREIVRVIEKGNKTHRKKKGESKKEREKGKM